MTQLNVPLEPNEEQRAQLHDAVMAFAERFVAARASAPASSSTADDTRLRRLLTPPGERARPLDRVLEDFADALDDRV